MKLVRWSPIIGMILFVYLMLRFDFRQVLAVLSGADPGFLFVVLAINLPLVFLKGLKWRMLIQTHPVHVPLLTTVAIWLKGFFIGIATPGRVGEMSRAYYLRPYLPSGTGVSTVVMDRILDLLVLFSLALLGIAVLLPFSRMGLIVLLFLCLFLGFVAGLVIVSKRKTIPFFLRPVSRRLIPQRYRARLSGLVADFYDGFTHLRRHTAVLLVVIALSLLTWIGSLIQFYALGRALHLPLSLTALVPIMPVVVLLDALPVSVSGIGTRDAALILLFAPLMISAAAAISFSLILLFLSYVPLALAGLFFWWRDPFRRAAE